MDNVSKPLALARLEAQFKEREGRELGIPKGTPVVAFTMDAAMLNPEWEGYSLEFLGEPVPLQRKPPAYVYAESDGVGMRVWKLCIRRDGVQSYIEALTQGVFGFREINLRNLDPASRGDNSTMLSQGMAMLYPRVYRSRPRGSGRFANAEEFHIAYCEALAELQRDNIKSSPEQIADRLGTSRRNFYRYKSMYGLPE